MFYNPDRLTFDEKFDISICKAIVDAIDMDEVVDLKETLQPTKKVTLKPNHIDYVEPSEAEMDAYMGDFNRWLESRDFNTD